MSVDDDLDVFGLGYTNTGIQNTTVGNAHETAIVNALITALCNAPSSFGRFGLPLFYTILNIQQQNLLLNVLNNKCPISNIRALAPGGDRPLTQKQADEIAKVVPSTALFPFLYLINKYRYTT